MAALDRRPYSEFELHNKLKEKECSEEDIRTVLALCTDYGFINDGEYACMLARRAKGKNYGPGRLKQELKQRGISEQFWTDALNLLDNSSEILDKLIAQRLHGKNIKDRKETDKVAASLFRKGYSWTDIRAALTRYTDCEDLF